MSPDSGAPTLSAFLAEAFGPSTLAVIHYGSHAQGRKPRADSAFDYFVVVDRYHDAYTSLRERVGTHYGPWLATRLANRLPPNVIAVSQPLADGTMRRAKCCVLSRAHFEWACSPHTWDHFSQGRLMQHVVVEWTRDDESARMVSAALASVRTHTIRWVRPSLPAVFSVEDYLAAALRRSLAGEIRPESADHSKTLAAAQLATIGPVYHTVCNGYIDQKILEAVGSGQFRLVHPVTRWERVRVALYFHHSKVRATTRLLKHVVLYDGWLDYIVRKVERSGNAPVELTERERKWPLIFLWPRVFRFLRTRPQRRQ
jgi:hypothetical protein